MPRKHKSMSLAMETPLVNLLDKCATNKNLSRSELMRLLVETFVCEEDIVPVAVSQELRLKLTKVANKKKIPLNEMLEKVLDRYICDDENEVIPVMLKIPKALKGDRDKLGIWLKTRFNALVENLC